MAVVLATLHRSILIEISDRYFFIYMYCDHNCNFTFKTTDKIICCCITLWAEYLSLNLQLDIFLLRCGFVAMLSILRILFLHKVLGYTSHSPSMILARACSSAWMIIANLAVYPLAFERIPWILPSTWRLCRITRLSWYSLNASIASPVIVYVHSVEWMVLSNV